MCAILPPPSPSLSLSLHPLQAHYSYAKAAIVLGLGTDNLIRVPTDASGAMDLAALLDRLAESRGAGRLPFFVGATAGSTVTGAFDPLEARAGRPVHRRWSPSSKND